MKKTETTPPKKIKFRSHGKTIWVWEMANHLGWEATTEGDPAKLEYINPEKIASFFKYQGYLNIWDIEFEIRTNFALLP